MGGLVLISLFLLPAAAYAEVKIYVRDASGDYAVLKLGRPAAGRTPARLAPGFGGFR